MTRVSLGLPVFMLAPLIAIPAVADDVPEPQVSRTFSIVAVDPETGVCGAAVASKYPAVGRVVPFVRAKVGAFCTQHWHEPEYGERALDLLADGQSCHRVLDTLLAGDKLADQRQLAIIDMQGRTAQHHPVAAEGESLTWGGQSGRFYACQGNTLAGPDVVPAMGKAFEVTEGSLTDRLLAGLLAADQAGGDHRGRLAAGIRVAHPDHEGLWFELYVDESDDAVAELVRQYAALEHPAKGIWKVNGQPSSQ